MAKVYDFADPVHDYTDHSGETYGKLTILKMEDMGKNGKRHYTVRCNECGKILHGMIMSVIKNEAYTKCIHPIMGKYKANWSHKKLREKYCAILDRCYNKDCSSYYNYGDRGITMCDEWRESPQAFNDWAMSHGYKEGLSIDRIDNDKGYSPDNCRWVTGHFNTLHRRPVKWMKVDGVENTLADWSRLFGYGRKFFNDYYDRHGEEATKKFIKEHIVARRRLISERPRHKFNINGKEMTIEEVTKYLGLKKTHLGHFIRTYGIDAGRDYVSQLVDDYNKEKSKKGPLVIKLGGKW